MGVLPLQFLEGEGRESLGLTGFEEYRITGISEGLTPGKQLSVRARDLNNVDTTFLVTARIDTPVEIDYYRNGGILQYVIRQMTAKP